MTDKNCQVCWQEVMDKILNEITIVGLDVDEARKKVREIEKFLLDKWAQIKKKDSDQDG